MTSSGEFSRPQPKSPYEQDVWARNQYIAENWGQFKAQEFESEIFALNQRHPGLIHYDAILEASKREHQWAAEKAIEERQAGLRNDVRSKAPGIFITGLLDYRVLAKLKQELELRDVEFELATEEMERFHIDCHYSLHLPEGAFEHAVPEEQPGQESLYVYPLTELDADGNIRKLNTQLPFLKGDYLDQSWQKNVTGNIGRIEGAGGALWQNPDTEPNGMPIRKTIRRIA